MVRSFPVGGSFNNGLEPFAFRWITIGKFMCERRLASRPCFYINDPTVPEGTIACKSNSDFTPQKKHKKF
jgi:hypothetical protein